MTEEEILHTIISGQDVDGRYEQFLSKLLKEIGYTQTIAHMSQFINYLTIQEIEEAVIDYLRQCREKQH